MLSVRIAMTMVVFDACATANADNPDDGLLFNMGRDNVGAGGMRELKYGPPKWFPFNPSWLYLILPIVMASMFLRMQWDLWRYRKPTVNNTPQPARSTPRQEQTRITDQERMQVDVYTDPELREIAHLLGRELTIEEWGRVPLSRMSERQLQALGFMPGCPFLNAPQYRGKSVDEVARLVGYSPAFIAAHKGHSSRFPQAHRCEVVQES